MSEARDLQPKAASKASQPTRPGRDERRRAILEVARDLFMQEGYAAGSMSEIATRVGGSKGTLYNYFASKELLFAALMKQECDIEALEASTLAVSGMNIHGALTAIGLRFLDFILVQRVVDIHRLVIAECGRFPELGRTFFENGPRRGVAILGDWMAEQMAEGRLRSADTERAATHFMELCKSGLHQKMLWNIEPAPSAAAKAANVEIAVTIFMAAYGPLDAPAPS